LVRPPSKDIEVGRLDASLLKLPQLELVGLFVNEPLPAAQVIGDNREEMRPGSRHNILGIEVPSKQNNLTPMSSRPRSQIDRQVVAAPVANQGNPRRMSINLLDSTGRNAVLFGKKILLPVTACRRRWARRCLLRWAGLTVLRAASESPGRHRRLVGNCVVEQVFLVNLSPIVPFLHDLFTIQQHGTENDAGGGTSTLLAIVEL
jgi:hypothetical protein